VRDSYWRLNLSGAAAAACGWMSQRGARQRKTNLKGLDDRVGWGGTVKGWED
jgi:hypothetical protein